MVRRISNSGGLLSYRLQLESCVTLYIVSPTVGK